MSFESILDSLRPLVSGDRAKDAVTEIARHHRIQASPGYDEAARWLVDELARSGLAPEVVTVPADGNTRYLGFPMAQGWHCTSAEAVLHGATEPELVACFATHALSLIQRSAPAHGRFRIVAVEDGVDPGQYDHIDVRDCVVLTSGSVQRVHQLAVVERGAAGLLSDGRRLVPPVRTEQHDRDSLAYTSFWWQGDQPRGWGFVLSPERGASVRARLAQDEVLTLEVDIRTERFTTEIPLVTATIPGTLPGEILLTAHLCHPQPSANDNGSGVAAVLESARALHALSLTTAWPEPRRTVRFLWMPEFTGTYAWLGGDPGRASRTVAALNLDMVGEDQARCGSTLLLEHPPHFAASFAEELLLRIRHAAQDWVTSYSGPGHYSMVRMGEVPYSGGSDHALWLDPLVGVPCPMLIQWPDRFYHSTLDTPEQVDPASLSLAVRSAATYAAFIASAGPQEIQWLLFVLARAARRRTLLALERPDPSRAAETERLRGLVAIASVERLVRGLPPEHPSVTAFRRTLPIAADELEGFHETEILPALARVVPSPTAVVSPPGRIPVRRLHALPAPMRHLIDGWPEASERTREEWYSLESAMGSTALDLAWFACDGRRDLMAIARALAAEGQPGDAAQLEHWFMLTEALGLTTWAVPE
ncbi:MAG: DUF4910 domain-containing protein [Candidatus Eisenbacteria bacterium]